MTLYTEDCRSELWNFSRKYNCPPSLPTGLQDADCRWEGGGGAVSGGGSVTMAQLMPGPAYAREDAATAAATTAALSNSQPWCSEPVPPQPLMDLPIEEQRLRHYTRSRPRPNRKNRQPPSKPQVCGCQGGAAGWRQE
ncbi:leucine-rich repeat-containing protein 16C [Arapaima gigas]